MRAQQQLYGKNTLLLKNKDENKTSGIGTRYIFMQKMQKIKTNLLRVYDYCNDTLEKPILRQCENLMKACMLLKESKKKLRSGIKD